MRIRPARGYNECMRYKSQTLQGRYSNIAYIFINNEYIAVINPPSNFNNLRQITLQVEEDIPVWKQCMNLQMGRYAERTKKSMCCMTFQRVNPYQVKYYSYKVYECY